MVMSHTSIKGMFQENVGSEKAKSISVGTKFPSNSKKIRGIISITDPAIIEEIAESDLLG